MGGDGPGPVRGLAALPDYHGLALADVLEHVEEATPVFHALHVHADHLRVGVLAEVFEVVGDIEDDGVAEADQLADLHPVGATQQAEIHALGAALADETHGPRLSGVLLGGEADAPAGDEEAHAVGPDQHEVGVPGHLLHLVLEGYPLLLGGFGEAGCEEGGAPDTLFDALLEDHGCELAGDGDDDEIYVVGDIEDALEVPVPHGLDVGDLPLVDLDGVDGALEGAHGVEPGVTEVLLVADDDGGFGVEESVELRYVDAH